MAAKMKISVLGLIVIFSISGCKEESFTKNDVISEINSGDIDNALRMAYKVKGYERESAFIKVANAYIRNGDADSAVEITRYFSNLYEKVYIYSESAEIMARNGNVDDALEAAMMASRLADNVRSDDDDFSKEIVINANGAFSAIALQQSVFGDVDGALETARLIKDGYDRSRALSKIAEAQSSSGNSILAKELFSEAIDSALFSGENWRRRALDEIAEAVLSVGDSEIRLELQKKIEINK